MGETAQTGEVFAAISAPVRREMLRRMTAEDVPVTLLADSFGLSLSAASQHLAILREANLVTVRRLGKQRLYRTNPEPLRAIAAWVDTYVPFWTDRLDTLKRTLETSPDDHQD